MSEPDDELIPVFTPSLAATLLNAEDKKGTPLTPDEVVSIRDEAPCIMMTVVDAREFEKTRYKDIDPENGWFEFQMLRRELGRKPDVDPGPSFQQIDSHSPEYQQAINNARSTLHQFRKMLPADGTPMWNASIKTRIVEGEFSSFMWLCNAQRDGSAFIAEFFEAPTQLESVSVGDERRITADNVIDWMVNEEGRLRGGYTLRHQRQQLPEDERASFDEYIGVTEYC